MSSVCSLRKSNLTSAGTSPSWYGASLTKCNMALSRGQINWKSTCELFTTQSGKSLCFFHTMGHFSLIKGNEKLMYSHFATLFQETLCWVREVVTDHWLIHSFIKSTVDKNVETGSRLVVAYEQQLEENKVTAEPYSTGFWLGGGMFQTWLWCWLHNTNLLSPYCV